MEGGLIYCQQLVHDSNNLSSTVFIDMSIVSPHYTTRHGRAAHKNYRIVTLAIHVQKNVD